MSESAKHSTSDETKEVSSDAPDPVFVDDMDAFDQSSSISSGQIQFALFVLMLLLALGGMGLTQSLESGAWEYWVFVVLVYASIGVWKAIRSARHASRSVRQGVVREISHWGTLVGFLGVLFFLEQRQVVDRQSASSFALMLLALSCFMAGVHLDWQLLLLGGVLTIMLVALALLAQYEIALWGIMLGVAFAAILFFRFKAKRRK
ncbi:MAG: hypothetical protein ACPGLY_05625 [Rubripirellula sp.]